MYPSNNTTQPLMVKCDKCGQVNKYRYTPPEMVIICTNCECIMGKIINEEYIKYPTTAKEIAEALEVKEEVLHASIDILSQVTNETKEDFGALNKVDPEGKWGDIEKRAIDAGKAGRKLNADLLETASKFEGPHDPRQDLEDLKNTLNESPIMEELENPEGTLDKIVEKKIKKEVKKNAGRSGKGSKARQSKGSEF